MLSEATVSKSIFASSLTEIMGRTLIWLKQCGVVLGGTEEAASGPFAALPKNAVKVMDSLSPNPVSPSIRNSDDSDVDSETWQDTDTLTNKTIPLYNFVRAYYHNNLYEVPEQEDESVVAVPDLATFPTAQNSIGSIMRDCPFCCIREQHCGFHAVPNQPPFRPKLLQGDNALEGSVKTLAAVFAELSYVELRKACRDVCEELIDDFGEVDDLMNIFTITRHRGWVG